MNEVTNKISGFMIALIIIAIILSIFLVVDGVVLNHFGPKVRWFCCKWGWKKVKGIFSKKAK